MSFGAHMPRVGFRLRGRPGALEIMLLTGFEMARRNKTFFSCQRESAK